MLKILQAHNLRTFVVNLKIDAIYAFYPESFCDKNLAIQKDFDFCDSARDALENLPEKASMYAFIHLKLIGNLQGFCQYIMADMLNLIISI